MRMVAPAIAGVVERMPRVCGAIVFEHVPLEPFEGDGAQEPRRHDPVGVEVVAAKRKPAARDVTVGHVSMALAPQRATMMPTRIKPVWLGMPQASCWDFL